MIEPNYVFCEEPNVDHRQRTLRNQVSCTGIGLHSGEKIKLTLKPAPPDSGIAFVRRDIPERPAIRARYKNVVNTNLCTTIGDNGHTVSTIEHLMAAFFGLGIDNARVEVEGPEVPIMDGSAAPFVFVIKSVGIKEQKAPKRFLVIKKPIKVAEGDKSISIHPSKDLRISYTIDFQHPLLKNQTYELSFSGRDFVQEISRARTFGFLKDINYLRENGLAMGGSLDNAIVIDNFRILNEDGLRYRDEFVRHKILDFLGDIAILGYPVIGHFVVEKSGHYLNHAMIQDLMGNRRCWEEVAFENPTDCNENSLKLPVFGTLDPIAA